MENIRRRSAGHSGPRIKMYLYVQKKLPWRYAYKMLVFLLWLFCLFFWVTELCLVALHFTCLCLVSITKWIHVAFVILSKLVIKNLWLWVFWHRDILKCYFIEIIRGKFEYFCFWWSKCKFLPGSKNGRSLSSYEICHC